MENNTKLSDRLKKFIDFKGLSINKFSASVQASNSYFNKVLKNNTSIGSDRMEKIIRTYPEISPEWLLTGEGTMLTYKTSNEQKILNDLEEEYAIKRQGIPLIPMDAMAGWCTGGSQIMEYEVDRYIVPEFEELNVDFMIRVRNDSMLPKFNSGDIVACKKLPSRTFFQWNKVYVLDTIQGALIKRVKKSKLDNHILCVSENEEYEPFDLNLEEVNSLALVVGVIGLE